MKGPLIHPLHWSLKGTTDHTRSPFSHWKPSERRWNTRLKVSTDRTRGFKRASPLQRVLQLKPSPSIRNRKTPSFLSDRVVAALQNGWLSPHWNAWAVRQEKTPRRSAVIHVGAVRTMLLFWNGCQKYSCCTFQCLTERQYGGEPVWVDPNKWKKKNIIKIKIKKTNKK